MFELWYHTAPVLWAWPPSAPLTGHVQWRIQWRKVRNL